MSPEAPCDWLQLASHPGGPSKISFECEAARGGARAVAGVDEAGRGPLAGPLVAAAVVLSSPVEGVDDSKKLPEARREALYAVLVAGRHRVGVAIVDTAVIDTHGIQAANYMAMAQALDDLDPAADFALVDGFTIRGCTIPQKRIIKGDQRSMSIAAASIIAKVTRDRIMVELDRVHPQYGFARHKGYGTQRHLRAIERNGPSAVHRRSFAPIAAAHENLNLFEQKDCDV